MTHFPCDLCHLIFEEAMSLSNHKCVVHADSIDLNRDGKKKKRFLCFFSRHDFFTKYKIETIAADYACNRCPGRFKTLSTLLFHHRTNHTKGRSSTTSCKEQLYSQVDNNDNMIGGTDNNIEDDYDASIKNKTDQKQTPPQPNTDSHDTSSLSTANTYNKSVLKTTGAINRSETEDLKPTIFKTDSGKEYRLLNYQATIDQIMIDPPTGGIWIPPT